MKKRLIIGPIMAMTLVTGGNAVATGAGLLAGGAQSLPSLNLSVMTPLAEKPFVLESGGYYEIDIICDGSGELALSGAEFFRNIWIDEVVIEDLEVRATSLHSFEFDDEGTITLKFVAIRPGRYEMRIPGSSGESQRAVFIIE